MTDSNPLRDENEALGVPGGAKAAFQAGVNNVDPGDFMEQGITLPWVVNPEYSWLNYQCWIETFLDAGMALHKPLPRKNPVPDTLGVGDVSKPEGFAGLKSGVNLKSAGGYTDFAQRCASSEYIFVMKGFAVRAGYKIPVPRLVTVGGVDATPGPKQWSRGNVIVANYSGVPVYMNQWELWYYVTSPPDGEETPPANLAQHLRSDVEPPRSLVVPYSQPDQNSKPTGVVVPSGQTGGGAAGGKGVIGAGIDLSGV